MTTPLRTLKLVNKIKKSGVAPKGTSMGKKETSEDVTTASIPNPADTAMGPKYKTSRVYDRRKKKGTPKLLKRFADYYKDKGIG